MNKSTAEGRIESVLEAAWAGKYPTNALDRGNRDSIDLEKERGKMFMTSEVLFPRTAQSAMVGQNSPHRIFGELHFTIFLPSGRGTRGITEVSDFMEETFGLKTISGILFRTVQEISKSNPETVDLCRRSCLIEFTFDSFTP